MESNYDYSHVYINNFNPRKYLTEFYSTLEGVEREGDALFFGVKANIEFTALLPKKMDRALDFGCGPVIHGLLPVADKIGSAVFADYVPANLLEVEKWMKNADDSFSFRPFSQAYSTPLGVIPEDLEAKLQSKFKDTMFCDVLAKDILPNNKGEQFDYIYTSLCIEGSCKTLDDYEHGILELAKLLKDGGHAIQFCVLNQNEYVCNGVKIPSLYVTFENAKESWVKAGCTVIDSQHYPNCFEGGEIGVCSLFIKK